MSETDERSDGGGASGTVALERPMAVEAAARLFVRVRAGDDAGRGVVVDRSVLVGTSDACELCLTDRTVSRRHATLAPSALGVVVRDEQSRNGVWLGTARLLEAELPVGASVRIGSTELEIVMSEPDALPAERGAALAPAAAPAGAAPRTGFGRFLGAAPVLQPVYAQLVRAAATEATVLLEGESGTGKELLAEAIHEQSARAEGPLVVVDCGSIPGNLVESELFGHERGAFTGADRRRLGAFEQASGGTLVLDEVGELPLAQQTRLLRALEQRSVRRVGGSEVVPVDVRVVAATNRNLDREVEQGRFRLDLFHRLAVVLVRVPPLRERIGDVPRLARHFASAFGGEDLLGPDVLARLEQHRWPGNVRELRNAIERLAITGEAHLATARVSRDDPFAATARSGLPYRQARLLALDAFTEAYVDDMLARHGGNVSAAARRAGVGRRYFQRMKQR